MKGAVVGSGELDRLAMHVSPTSLQSAFGGAQVVPYGLSSPASIACFIAAQNLASMRAKAGSSSSAGFGPGFDFDLSRLLRAMALSR